MAKKTVSSGPKKAAVPNANISKGNKPKVVYLDEWVNFNTFERSVQTNLSLERLAKELVDWFKSNPDAIKISQFLEEKGIHQQSWQRWCNLYPVLNEAKEWVKMVIGTRREVGIMTRKYEPGFTAVTMYNYCNEFTEASRMKASIVNRDGGLEGGQKIVVIERFPDSPLVPVKKKDIE